MTQVTQTTFKATTQSIYPDNTTGEISPADLRTQMDNIADSAAFKKTGNAIPPTINDDTYNVGDLWADENNNVVYICMDNSTGAAVWIDITTVLTDAEIKTAYENNADTNAFTDAEQTKLVGIETAATADQTGAEIKAAYEAEADTNAFTDAEKTKLAGANTEITTTTYTVTNADLAGSVLRRLNNAAAITITVSPGLTGTEVTTWIQTGAGQVTFAPGAGVTIQSADGNLSTRVQFSSASLIPDSDTADLYYLVGDLA